MADKEAPTSDTPSALGEKKILHGSFTVQLPSENDSVLLWAPTGLAKLAQARRWKQTPRRSFTPQIDTMLVLAMFLEQKSRWCF